MSGLDLAKNIGLKFDKRNILFKRLECSTTELEKTLANAGFSIGNRKFTLNGTGKFLSGDMFATMTKPARKNFSSIVFLGFGASV